MICYCPYVGVFANQMKLWIAENDVKLANDMTGNESNSISFTHNSRDSCVKPSAFLPACVISSVFVALFMSLHILIVVQRVHTLYTLCVHEKEMKIHIRNGKYVIAINKIFFVVLLLAAVAYYYRCCCCCCLWVRAELLLVSFRI